MYRKPNTLKQSVNIEVISKNIIDITIGLVLETVNKVDTENKVKINRVTNHRAIDVVSLLFNVIFVYLVFKIFSVFLKSINLISRHTSTPTGHYNHQH